MVNIYIKPKNEMKFNSGRNKSFENKKNGQRRKAFR